jgi:hypothetical protein
VIEERHLRAWKKESTVSIYHKLTGAKFSMGGTDINLCTVVSLRHLTKLHKRILRLINEIRTIKGQQNDI